MNETIKTIMIREKISGEKLAGRLKMSAISFRRMIRGDIKMSADVFAEALSAMGYKIMIVKKEDLV